MGLSSKHVSGDHQAGSGGGFEWGSLQSGAAEQSKPPSTRRQQAEPLKCPRCNSANTKFCYYNNYNKSQPRHFCKSCKRHWTKGGTLRNVPVGGGRKNKRPKISKPATTTNTAAAPRQQDFPDFDTGAQKSVPNFIYQALLHETTKGFNNTTNSGGLSDNNPTSEFHFSSLLNTSTFDMNVSLNPTCYHPFDHYAEESTITTVNIPISSSSGPWDSTSTLDLPNYWNWSDIDVLNSADLNISWDDNDDSNADQVKPQNKFHD